MSQQPDQARVSVRIMEKGYLIACPYEERSALLDAAELLNGRMREIRDTGKVVGLDRIAVMVALNLAHEFLKGRDRGRSSTTASATACARCASGSRERWRRGSSSSCDARPPLGAA